jgi:hypothetical protein
MGKINIESFNSETFSGKVELAGYYNAMNNIGLYAIVSFYPPSCIYIVKECDRTGDIQTRTEHDNLVDAINEYNAKIKVDKN